MTPAFKSMYLQNSFKISSNNYGSYNYKNNANRNGNGLCNKTNYILYSAICRFIGPKIATKLEIKLSVFSDVNMNFLKLSKKDVFDYISLTIIYRNVLKVLASLL